MDTAAGVMSASDARVDAVLQGDVGTLDAIVDDFYGGDAGKVRDAGDDANEGKEGRVASMIERARGRARREDDARVKGTMDGFPARRGRDAARAGRDATTTRDRAKSDRWSRVGTIGSVSRSRASAMVKRYRRHEGLTKTKTRAFLF